MNQLLNPYLSGPRAGVDSQVRTLRAAAVVLAGAAVVTGCGSSAETTAAKTSAPAVPAAPTSAVVAPTMPVPTSAAAPNAAAGAASNAPVPRPAQLTKPHADYTVVRGDSLSALAGRFTVKGGWPVLFERNKDVLWNPNLIIVGQQLDIDGR